MKYLGMLKDSFYETLDFKIFYVMIGGSLLFCLALGCFTFPRLPVAETLHNNLPEFVIDDVQTVERMWLRPQTRYRVTLSPDPEQKTAEGMKRAIKAAAWEREVQDTVLQGRIQEAQAMQVARATQGNKTPEPQAGPKDSQEWRRLFDLYVDTVHGISEPKILAFETGGDGFIQRVDMEFLVHWGELRKAHHFKILFGIRGWDWEMSDVGVGQVVPLIQSKISDWIAGIAGIIVAIIVSAGFIPNMLRKGTVDLLLVKPIGRVRLLVYKYLGGLTFVFFNAVVFVGGTWLVFGLTANIWSPWYLVTIPLLTFFFAILYAFSTLVSVVTRSQITTILLTIVCWAMLWGIGFAYEWIGRPTDFHKGAVPFLADVPTPISDAVAAIHFVLPKTRDLSILNEALLLKANSSPEAFAQQAKLLEHFSWFETIGTSVAFIAVMLGLACWRFSRRDY